MRRVTIENIFLFLCSMSVLLNVMPGQVFAQDVPAPQPDPVNINEEIDAPAYAVAPQETILPMPRTVTPSTENPSTPPLLEEVDLKEVEVTDVLKMISQKSGLNIVIGSTVTGKVSLYLKGVGERCFGHCR